MRAMLFEQVGKPLRFADVPIPQPLPNQILVRVKACAICRTDRHIIEGDLKNPLKPLIMGHQIVGEVVERGEDVHEFEVGDRVGIPWLAKCCGKCFYCFSGQENLCDDALYTGYTVNGGFAEYCVAYAAFAFKLPTKFASVHIAPLLCGGLIGYRAYRMIRKAQHIGFYGFGSSAHMLIQIAKQQKKDVYVFTRPGDAEGQKFADSLGASWSGSADTLPPVPLDGAIIFAAAGELIPLALRAVRKGATVVCAGIHMSQIPPLDYNDLWGERVLRSVMNLTRQDGNEFLALATSIPVQTQITVYPLGDLNQALADMQDVGTRLLGTSVIEL